MENVTASGRRGGIVAPPTVRMKFPSVSQKVRALSARTSMCNLPNSPTVPEAFRRAELVQLYAKGVSDVEALASARVDLGVAHLSKGSIRKDTRVVLGKTCVGLNSEESNTLADDIVQRVWREDVSRACVQEAHQAGEKFRRFLERSSSAAKKGGLSRAQSSSSLVRSLSMARMTSVSSFRLSSRDDCSVLLFPTVVRALERWLLRARERIRHRALVLSERCAESTCEKFLKRRALWRWVRVHHAFLIGSRASLNRIVRKWKKFTQQRAQMRRKFYQCLMRSIDNHRLHRLLCIWYAYHVAEGALRATNVSSGSNFGSSVSKVVDPHSLLMMRPAGRSLWQRRPEIVLQAIDAVHATKAKTDRLGVAIVNHQSKSLRMPWDAWRAYIFVRRNKSNHYQMLRLHRNGRVATRVMSHCFSKWRFRMNASRSLSLYLYRLQSHALTQWRSRTQLMVEDQARVEQLGTSKALLTKRSCLHHWRQKSKESNILDLVGNCRALEKGAALLPYAFVFAQMISESVSGVSGAKNSWAEGRANAALCCRCFQQWRRVWLRRNKFLRIVKQQHRLYCGMLLRRAFVVWRSVDTSWDDVQHLHQMIDTQPYNTDGTVKGSPSGKETVPPLVRLFGPRIDDATIPWVPLRTVERHCRRSYSALGNLQAVTMFAHKRLFDIDETLFCQDRSSSQVTRGIADRLFEAASSHTQRCLSQCSSASSNTLQLEEETPQPLSFALGTSLSIPLGAQSRNVTQRIRSNKSFYHFLLRRVLQAMFVVGRVIIASKHASTRLNEFRDLMFSKHVVLSRERITDLQDALHGFAVDTGISAPVSRSQRLGASKTTSGMALAGTAPNGDAQTFVYQSSDRLSNRCAYLDTCIARRSTDFLQGDLVTEQEAFVENFATQLQGYKESLQQKYKAKLLAEAPLEVLCTLARLGFPMLELTDVEHHLDAIASFLNEQIATNVALRVAFRMRRSFVLTRWAVVDAALSYWTAAGVATYQPPSSIVPKPPAARKKRGSSATQRKKPPAVTWKRRSLRSEHLALAIAIRMRVSLALRRLPDSYSSASIVCLVPPKTLVQTISRSQNAPDKLLRAS